MTHHPHLILRIMARLGELTFEERFLPTEGQDAKGRRGYVYGQTEYDGRIIVNPIPHIVDTVIHECLHELSPNYAESAIKSLTVKLMRQLTDTNLQTIYAEYKRKVDGD